MESEVVTIRSLMEEFGYTFNGAKRRIYLLYNEGLIEPLIDTDSWAHTKR
jgi:hypothetical protein